MNGKPSVAIIGVGEMGSALGELLKKKDVHVEFWDKNIDLIMHQKALAEIIPPVDFLFFCVPSSAMTEAAKSALPFLNQKTVIVSLAKGIEEKSKDTMDKLLKKLLPENQSFAILGGPMLAEELSKGMEGSAVVGTAHKISFEKLSGLFENTNLSLEYSDDAQSVAIAGVLKNIYAIGLGIADGLGWGENKKGQLLTKSIQEMAHLTTLLGGKEEIIYGLAGLGDLIATSYSSYSTNRKVGESVARTGQHPVSEGFKSLPIIMASIAGKEAEFEILPALNKILLENQNAKTIFGQLFRQSK